MVKKNQKHIEDKPGLKKRALLYTGLMVLVLGLGYLVSNLTLDSDETTEQLQSEFEQRAAEANKAQSIDDLNSQIDQKANELTNYSGAEKAQKLYDLAWLEYRGGDYKSSEAYIRQAELELESINSEEVVIIKSKLINLNELIIDSRSAANEFFGQ